MTIQLPLIFCGELLTTGMVGPPKSAHVQFVKPVHLDQRV